MTLLATLLGNLFASLLTWFGTYVTKRVAFGLAAVTAYSTITLTLYIAFRATLAGLASYAALPPFLLMILGIAVPPAAAFCVGSYMTIWAACTVYSWKVEALSYFKNV